MRRHWRAAYAAVCALLVLLLSACAALPTAVTRVPSRALSASTESRLGRALAPHLAAHPGLTGIYPLREGQAAFAARDRLAAAAERSIDVQYYIWHADTSGSLLAHALWQAAERGVRVRLLLDDARTQGLDPFLAALDAHANIEVRIFNPFANRGWRVADFAWDFGRVHRRMHNKTFVVDNQVAVVGGRNIGDEYLGAAGAVEFSDLDVVAAGAVVTEVSASFDAYWNSEAAYPVASLMPPAPAGTAQQSALAWAALQEKPEAKAYMEAVRDSQVLPQLLAGGDKVEWTVAHLLADDPAKVLEPTDRSSDQDMLPRLLATLGRPQEELLLVSPYFVPTRQGTEALAAIAARGVRVSVLTNSLAATDVSVTYAGYAKYRHDLLRAGIRLYELKPSASQLAAGKDTKRAHRGSSGASLHAKTFAVDRQRIYVGSFNLDPRSARLNTEAGVMLESAALAGALSEFFAREVPLLAYEVRLAEGDGSLVWIDRSEGREVRHATAPETGLLRRIGARVMGWLPVEWLL